MRFEVACVYFAQHCFFLPLTHLPVGIENAAATSKKTKDPSLHKGNRFTNSGLRFSPQRGWQLCRSATLIILLFNIISLSVVAVSGSVSVSVSRSCGVFFSSFFSFLFFLFLSFEATICSFLQDVKIQDLTSHAVADVPWCVLVNGCVSLCFICPVVAV